MSAPLILGQDGKVHDGHVQIKFSGAIMITSCGAEAMRPLAGPEQAMFMDRMGRACPECFEEVE